ncbi:efflux RND transporter periplasmic adaptor subunit [Pectobacterium actinidiae]|uniref:Efflux RND transporter periplasmic adaptor subunit n=1 Tax=Pectobacterium actinidiae TaxID=1507808 RepID=A0ABW8G634_9GAMM
MLNKPNPVLLAPAGQTKRLPVMLTSAVACLMLVACKEEPTPAAPTSTEVVVEEVKTQSLALASEFPGRTVAFQSSQVRPQIGGILKQRLFTEGADVKSGQVLYKVDPAPYEAALESAQADVLAARPKAQRYRELLKLDAVSRQEADDATSELRRGEAAVRTARINLDNTRIKAPISGRISTSNYTAGALVSAEQSEALATINQLDPVYVDIVQPSAQWLALRRQIDAGQVVTTDGKPQVRLTLEDGIAYDKPGTLEVVEAAVQETTGNVKLRAVFPNPDNLLLPGMYVRARLSMATNQQAILIPQQAVSRNGKGEALVLLVGQDSKVEQRIVRTGQAAGDRWVVTAGLKAGEKIIVEGGQRTRPGQNVTAVPPAAPKATPQAK